MKKSKSHLRRPHKALWVADPWETLDHARDSTLHLARVAEREHGVVSSWATPERLAIQANSKLNVATLGQLNEGRLVPNKLGKPVSVDQTFDSIHWRVDPPVTIETIETWQILASMARSSTPIINSPKGLLLWPEKSSILRFPKNSILSNLEMWHRFKHPGREVIAKTLSNAASRGVRILGADPNSANATLREITRSAQSRWILTQEIQKQIFKLGETRVFVIAGRPFDWTIIKRFDTRSGLIGSLDADPEQRPKLALKKLSDAHKKISTTVGRALWNDGVLLSSIDFIGNKILEINVTSVGLIRWLDENIESKQDNPLARAYWSAVFKILYKKK